jgi:hypothetical protein
MQANLNPETSAEVGAVFVERAPRDSGQKNINKIAFSNYVEGNFSDYKYLLRHFRDSEFMHAGFMTYCLFTCTR